MFETAFEKGLTSFFSERDCTVMRRVFFVSAYRLRHVAYLRKRLLETMNYCPCVKNKAEVTRTVDISDFPQLGVRHTYAYALINIISGY